MTQQAGTSISGSQASVGDQSVEAGQLVPQGDSRTEQVIIPNPGKTEFQMKNEWAKARAERANAVDIEMPAPVRGDPMVEGSGTPDDGEAVEGEAPEAPSTAKDAGTAPKTPAKAGTAAEDPERLARVTRMAEGARRASQAARERRAQFEATTQRAAQAEARAIQAEQRAARGQQIEEGIRRSPLDAIRQTTGLTIQQLTDLALKEGTPEAKIDALAQGLKASEEARQKLEESIAARDNAARREAHNATQEANYLKAATSKVKAPGATEAVPRYPNLAGIDKPTLVAMAIGVAVKTQARYAKEGLPYVQPTNRQILEHLNDSLGRAKPKEPSASEHPKDARSAPSKAVKPGTGKTPASPRTATNSMSSGTPSHPANFASLPRSKRIEILSRG